MLALPIKRKSLSMAPPVILKPGLNCWRVEHARRVAFLVDGQDYFAAVLGALRAARRSVLLLGWGFDPRTRLLPDGFERGDEPDEIGRVLLDIAGRPGVDVRVLIWKSALPIEASQDFFPHRARAWFADSAVKFRLDNAIPLAGCHHQKVLVIDDKVAFCGGADFGVDRWDTPAHADSDARRIDPSFSSHPPRHEVAMLVDGGAARALGDLARERWRRASGEAPEPPPMRADDADDPWPRGLRPDLTDVQVAIVRTEPPWRGRPLVQEWKRLTLAAIADARRTIYLENQYFTSPIIAEALARRLAEPDGPEIVLVSTEASPSWFDRLSMDRARGVALARLRAADIFGRFLAFCPETTHGRPIIVHAKLCITDDRLLRIGSANLNNRSLGLDTECELAIEATDASAATAILGLRDRLIGHYVNRSAGDVARSISRQRGLIAGIEALNHGQRLKPIEPPRTGPLVRLIAGYHLGDPLSVGDAWRPWRRRTLIEADVRAIAAGASAPDG
jgi:phosphatidylserine/phosphatidylglycerophosphate/cardiolipin synthase-like enzyme